MAFNQGSTSSNFLQSCLSSCYLFYFEKITSIQPFSLTKNFFILKYLAQLFKNIWLRNQWKFPSESSSRLLSSKCPKLLCRATTFSMDHAVSELKEYMVFSTANNTPPLYQSCPVFCFCFYSLRRNLPPRTFKIIFIDRRWNFPMPFRLNELL